MALVERAKQSGLCPPPLLGDAIMMKEDEFDTQVLNVVDTSGVESSGLGLREDIAAVQEFEKLMKVSFYW